MYNEFAIKDLFLPVFFKYTYQIIKAYQSNIANSNIGYFNSSQSSLRKTEEIISLALTGEIE